MGKRFASGKYAKAVSDRSGFVYPWREMVREPGTGFIVHKSESDGKYNLVDHPQNHVARDYSDAIALRWSRPEVSVTAGVTVSLPYHTTAPEPIPETFELLLINGSNIGLINGNTLIKVFED